MVQAQTKIIYVGDPMCSWCYGISGELKKIWENYPDMDKEVVLGGLRPGGGDAWTPEFTDFLREHWQQVHDKTGMPFSYDLLDFAEFNYDTEPACRAVHLLRQRAPSKDLMIFTAVQEGFYLQGKDPKQPEFYQDICRQVGVDYAEFKVDFSSAGAKSSVARQFVRARTLGVSSFPTVLLDVDGTVHVIARGYDTAQNMIEEIEGHLSE